jgi:hypothetical protein
VSIAKLKFGFAALFVFKDDLFSLKFKSLVVPVVPRSPFSLLLGRSSSLERANCRLSFLRATGLDKMNSSVSFAAFLSSVSCD